MKIIRKEPPMDTSGAEVPRAEYPKLPAIEVTVQTTDASTMRAAVEALQAATERMQAVAPQASAPQTQAAIPAQQKPKAFTVTVTKRDAKGRAAEFDVRVKEEAPQEEEPDAFTSGFNTVREANES